MSNVKVSIIYYSSTGNNYQMAKWAKEAAEELGAEVRLRKVEELAPEAAISKNPLWKKHYDEAKDVPVATSEDLDWADAIIFSTPTRFGNVASQMKQFLDLQGGLWAQGKLVNKVVSAMSSAQNSHVVKRQLFLPYTKPCATGEQLLCHQDLQMLQYLKLEETHMEQLYLWIKRAKWWKM